jgi:DNA-binding MarR family transcriptional regulator
VDERWLTEREDGAWRGLLTLRTDLFGHLSRELTRDTGLSEADYVVLVAVSEAPGRRMRARDLGQSLHWDRARLSHQISRMESRGTVCRDACEGDARGYDVVLTPAGLRAVRGAARVHVEAVRHCFVDLLTPAQLDALAEIGALVSGHLAAEHRSADD